MPSKSKAFTFGVLNKSASKATKLVFRAIVSPDRYSESPWTFKSAEENTERFDALLDLPTVAERLAFLRLPLTIPKEPPAFFVGRSVPVDLTVQPGEKKDSEARKMLDKMGPVENGALKKIRDNFKRPPIDEDNTCAMEVPPSQLQECALGVHFPDKEGYAIVVEHWSEDDESKIGELTLVFLPDHPRGRKKKKRRPSN
jgi:hypothetical protein